MSVVRSLSAVASSGGGGGTTIDVGGSEHIMLVGAGAITATNVPVAPGDDVFTPTGSPGGNVNRRVPAYLVGRTEARIFVGGGTSGAACTAYVQYSLNGGSSWDYLDAVSGPSVSLASLGATVSTTVGAWVTITALARADVLLRCLTIGNGVSDPTIGHLGIEVR